MGPTAGTGALGSDAVRDDFVQAMRRQASTVAIITTTGHEGWSGMVATAVISVCADPPTLLVAINQSASLHPAITAHHHFCVNLLSGKHRDLVKIFSGQRKGRERFEVGEWVNGPRDVPVLENALSSLVCRTVTSVDIGTHTLFIGEVEQVVNHIEIDPLVWVDGGMTSIARQS